MLTVGLIAVSLTVGLLMQVVHGQTKETAKTEVDKLIEDTKKVESYKAELINRIQNSNCTHNLVPGLGDNEIANLLPDDAKKYNDTLYSFSPLYQDIQDMPSLAKFRMPFMSIENLERYLKDCVREGWIK